MCCHSGIGPSLRVGDISTLAFPTNTFKDRVKINVGGLELELIHAPGKKQALFGKIGWSSCYGSYIGETNDQIYVYYAEKNVLFAGDNIYKAFPNIYAIRGTPSRDAMQWARSLDIIRDIGPGT